MGWFYEDARGAVLGRKAPVGAGRIAHFAGPIEMFGLIGWVDDVDPPDISPVRYTPWRDADE